MTAVGHTGHVNPHAALHRTRAELEASLGELDAAPKDEGQLELVVARPASGERAILDEGLLHRDVGLVGDVWHEDVSSRAQSSDRDRLMQITVMSARMVRILAGDDVNRQALAGDQLYVDLDLSHESLPAGSRLVFGDPSARGAVIEVNEEPHTGCASFVERFGADAMRFVNGREGRARRLRGLHAVVVQAGAVRPGDPVKVVRPG